MKLLVLTLLTLMTGNVIVFSQRVDFRRSPAIDDSVVKQLLEKYRAVDVVELKRHFSQVTADQSAREAFSQLPTQWKQISLTIAQGAPSRLWIVGEKAVKITTSPKYEFVYLDTSVPLAVSDSNCLLVVTEGMLQLTENNDDALLGILLHEIAHGLFVEQTISVKRKLNAMIENKNWSMVDKLRQELAVIELECDLIAGKLLLDEGYKVRKFADLLMRLYEIEEKSNTRNFQWHPAGQLRKYLLEELAKKN